MSIAELELKTQTFADSLSNEELSQAEELLWEIQTARRCDAILDRIDRGETRTIPWEVAAKELAEQFGFELPSPAL